MDGLCLKQEVGQGEEGSSRLSPQSFQSVSHPIKKRGDKRKVGMDQDGVSTEPDAEAEMPPVTLRQPLAVPELLLFSAVPEAHIFAYLRAKIILLPA